MAAVEPQLLNLVWWQRYHCQNSPQIFDECAEGTWYDPSGVWMFPCVPFTTGTLSQFPAPKGFPRDPLLFSTCNLCKTQQWGPSAWASERTLLCANTVQRALFFSYVSMNKNDSSRLCKCRNLEIPLPIKIPVTPLPCHWGQVTLNHFTVITNWRICMCGRHRSVSAFSFKWCVPKNANTWPSLALPLPSPVSILKTANIRDTQILLKTAPRFLGCLWSSMGHFILSAQDFNSHRDFQLKGTILIARYSDWSLTGVSDRQGWPLSHSLPSLFDKRPPPPEAPMNIVWKQLLCP